jgi:hypothetical protein
MRQRACAVSRVFFAALALAAGSATADWLVMTDGAAVETQGPWQVRGRAVVFSDVKGQLVSLQLAQVDLEASAERTAGEAAKAATPPPVAVPAVKAPVLVLTDKDVSHTTDAGTPQFSDAAGVAADAAPARPREADLAVVSWQRVTLDEGSGSEVYGSLRNNGTSPVTNLTVVVNVVDAEGKMIASADGAVADPTLGAGRSTNFRARFPGIGSFDRARFRVNGVTVESEIVAPVAGGENQDEYQPPPL